MSFPAFDLTVPSGGYAWWYLDALSDDGRHGLTLIAFVGSVFSPYYASARARREADPEDHTAVNLALYGQGSRWAMTERRRANLFRDAATLSVGPSRLEWNGEALTAHIDEWTVPIPRRLRGRLTVHPLALPGKTFALDAPQHHRWWPVAPRVLIEADFEYPALRWRGQGYLDHNAGDEPLEDGFADWQWCRVDLGEDTAVLYDANRRDGTDTSLALRFDPAGRIERFEPPAWKLLPMTGWRVSRSTRAEDNAAQVVETWEDTPFYARSRISQRLFGADRTAVHESLSLDRFRTRWVQTLLPFRMPRL